MSVETRPDRIPVTVVHSPACHFCDDAEQALAALGRDYPIDVTVVPVESASGAALVVRHRPAMNPLVLVDGEFFSSGRLPRKKLVRLLKGRRAAMPTAAVPTGAASSGAADR